MNHQELKDLLPLYTLGGLDHESAAEVERHLGESCHECAAEVREWREVVGLVPLGLTPAGPDVSVRERLMARVREDLAVKTPASLQPQMQPPRRRSVWMLPLAAAAVVLLIIGGLQYQKVTREAADQAAQRGTMQTLLAEEQKKLAERETEIQRLQAQIQEQQTAIAEKVRTDTQLATALAEQQQLVSAREQELLSAQEAAARERAAAEKQVATLKAELARRGESVAGGQELSQLRTAVERQRALGEIDTREIALLRAALARQRGVIEVLSTPELRIGALSQVKPGTVARGHMVWNEHGKAWLISTFGLPAPPAGKAYQAWFLTEKGGPVSAGLFTADQAGTGLVVAASPAQRFGKVSAVAVTLEPAEGLTKPSGEIYLRGSL